MLPYLTRTCPLALTLTHIGPSLTPSCRHIHPSLISLRPSYWSSLIPLISAPPALWSIPHTWRALPYLSLSSFLLSRVCLPHKCTPSYTLISNNSLFWSQWAEENTNRLFLLLLDLNIIVTPMLNNSEILALFFFLVQSHFIFNHKDCLDN